LTESTSCSATFHQARFVEAAAVFDDGELELTCGALTALGLDRRLPGG
jgi:hypothetical protein